ncbi:hypothetical protein V6N12_020601 [Hibiscus sabdariffa]|uniref:RNase H type-1 domain-containing protein n=1 Tax=Hibiscus sabdariffa TaxID=183260 RepID=A0ABR2CYL3_9ROSI
MEVEGILRGTSNALPKNTLVDNLCELLVRDCNVIIQCISREQNKTADALAALGRDGSIDVILYEYPLNFLVKLISNDIHATFESPPALSKKAPYSIDTPESHAMPSAPSWVGAMMSSNGGGFRRFILGDGQLSDDRELPQVSGEADDDGGWGSMDKSTNGDGELKMRIWDR